MNLISLEGITKVYTERQVFDNADFYLNEGEKVGIIGVNGTGKSTLLKMIAGLEEPDEGKVVRASHVVVEYLPQQPQFPKGSTVLESVLHGHEKDTWDVETQAKSMLTKLGVTNWEQAVEELSGGQKKRLALVSALMTSADVLVLDEPTNHLDHEMSEWLEQMLKNLRKVIVMVTHDRYFLDSVANRIVEIEHGKIYSYKTDYAGYLELKTERQSMELATERKRQSVLRTELAWIMRGARARSTKQKARIERYEQLKKQDGPIVEQALELYSASARMGRTTVEIENISKAYGDKKLIEDFSYIFLKNDRIGFIGRNGCGKTTLMKILTGRQEPDSGAIKIGQTIKIGYFAQEFESEENKDSLAYMDPSMKVIDYIKNTAEYVKTPEGSISASMMLERFLFPASAQYSPIEKLSGGEKRRLNLLRVLMEAPNVLILDEPTNDLDIRTLTILEDYLDRFEGIVIAVSHDRYFLDRVTRRIFAFEEEGRLVQHEGGYTDYLLRKEAEEKKTIGNMSGSRMGKSTENSPGNLSGNGNQSENGTGSRAEGKKYQNTHAAKLKFTFKEQQDYETIEAEIAELEEKLAETEKQIEKAATDYGKLNALTKEKEELEAALDEKMQRWMYLEDLAERIRNQ